ncbi:hypothetical protein ACLOJK_038162 [Asimina triloba]
MPVAKKPNMLPSPFKLPILGNLHQLGGSLFHRSLQALSNQHGPLMLLQLGSVPAVIVSSAEMAEEVLKTHDVAFAGRPLPLSKAARDIIYGCNDVAFAPYGDYWRYSRKIFITELLSPKRVKSFANVREEEVGILMKEISTSCSSSSVINLTEMLLALTCDIISRIALGRKYSELLGIAKEMEAVMGSLSVGNFVPWLRWMDTINGLDGRMKRFHGVLDSFLDQIISDRGNDDDDANLEELQDFVDVLLDIQKNPMSGDRHLSLDNLKALIADTFIAAIGSTTVTMEWAMTELMRNPPVMKKAQEEVRKTVGNKGKVEEADLAQMNYLRMIIKEALRVHPPGPLLLPHESTESSTIKGYHIPEKTMVLINVWAIARDPKSWENPDAFVPERFINNPVDFTGQDYQFLPFGSGRRICPGIRFSMGTIELALANLLYWFEWDLPAGENHKSLDMSESSGIVVQKKFPLLLVPKNAL